MKAPIPPNEAERIAALERQHILDTLPEEAFDRIVSIACQVCETPIGLVCLIDSERQWFKARIGVELEETERDISFCAHVVAGDLEILVEDARLDPRFSDNIMVCGGPQVRFYFGVPVRDPSGQPLGTLCVLDLVPRALTKSQVGIMRQLAGEVETALRLRERERELQVLLDQRAVTSAMIAHDAANLMTRTVGELEMLRFRLTGDDLSSAERALSGAERLIRMCKNFVDLHSEHRLPLLDPQLERIDLQAWFRMMARREARRAAAESLSLQAHCELKEPMHSTDISLLERLAINLLDNAYRSSPSRASVRFFLEPGPRDGFSLTVEDAGPGVPEELRERIFEPFFSTHNTRSSGVAGLGLAFCRLAAEALGGCIAVSKSARGGALFRVEIPQ